MVSSVLWAFWGYCGDLAAITTSCRDTGTGRAAVPRSAEEAACPTRPWHTMTGVVEANAETVWDTLLPGPLTRLQFLHLLGEAGQCGDDGDDGLLVGG